MGAPSGALSAQEVLGAKGAAVKVMRTLPRVTGGLSLVSVTVNVLVPGLGFLELTVKLTFPSPSVAAVWLPTPIAPKLIISPGSAVLVKVIWSPDKLFFKLSFTVTEMVAVVAPSAGIEEELTEIVELTASALFFAKTKEIRKR